MGLTTISESTPGGKVSGVCDEKFAGVVEAFVENLTARDEVGANVAITLEGEKVVDLWGGKKERDGAVERFEVAGVAIDDEHD